jgi:hypothetical protein
MDSQELGSFFQCQNVSIEFHEVPEDLRIRHRMVHGDAPWKGILRQFSALATVVSFLSSAKELVKSDVRSLARPQPMRKRGPFQTAAMILEAREKAIRVDV